MHTSFTHSIVWARTRSRGIQKSSKAQWSSEGANRNWCIKCPFSTCHLIWAFFIETLTTLVKKANFIWQNWPLTTLANIKPCHLQNWPLTKLINYPFEYYFKWLVAPFASIFKAITFVTFVPKANIQEVYIEVHYFIKKHNAWVDFAFSETAALYLSLHLWIFTVQSKTFLWLGLYSFQKRNVKCCKWKASLLSKI